MNNASRDGNRVPTALGVSSINLSTPTSIAVNPSTGAVLIDSPSLYAGLDSRYLKLDTSNSPLTGGLTIQPATNTLTALVVNNNASGNVLTVDTINNRVGIGVTAPAYRLQVGEGNFNFSFALAPSTRLTSAAGTAGALTGNFYYRYTYTTINGETEVSPSSVALVLSSQQANLSDILVGPAGTLSRKIYRSTSGGNVGMKLVATISDNVTTSIVDNNTSPTTAAPFISTIGGRFFLNGSQSLAMSSVNTFMGYRAGEVCTGFSATIVGALAGLNAQGPQNITLIGTSAGQALTTGNDNTAVGYAAMTNNSTGASNVYLGFYSGYNMKGGSNTVIGYEAGSNFSGAVTTNNNIFLGYFAGIYETGSQKLIIDNLDRTNEATQRTSALLYGVSNATVTSQTLTANGHFGVNIVPTATLHIAGIEDTQQLIVKANATQTANLTEWQNSSGTVQAYVNSTGGINSVSGFFSGIAPSTLYRGNFNNSTTDPASTSAGSRSAMSVYITADTSNTYTGAVYFAELRNGGAGNHTGTINGVSGEVYNSSAKSCLNLVGNNSTVGGYSGGAITNLYNYKAALYIVGSGAITNSYLFYGVHPATTGVITNGYGLYLGDINRGGTLNYAIYTNLGKLHWGDDQDIAEAKNIILGTTTGSQIGTAVGQKLAFHGSTAVIQRAGAAQVAVATTGSTNITPYGFTTSAQADAIITLLNEIRATLVEKGLMKGAA